MLGLLFALFGVACLVLSPFAFYQIITKSGYSGWWTFVPYTPWIVAFLGSAIFRTVDTNRSIGTVFDQLGLWLVLTVLSGVFVMVMFFIFAFSAWPSLQVARARSAPRPAFSSGGVGPPPPVPVASGTPTAPEQHEGQAPGWYRTGVLGAGEQSYWDGQTWTARRIWNRGAWKALPPEDQSLDQPPDGRAGVSTEA